MAELEDGLPEAVAPIPQWITTRHASPWMIARTGRARARRSSLSRHATLLCLLLLGGLASSATRMTDTAAAASSPSGRLVVTVAGLPPGQRPAGTVKGPGIRTSLTSRTLVLKSTRPGPYIITLRSLKIAKGRGPVRKGARAFPTRRQLRVRVKSRKTTTVSAAYGTVVNPGVRKLPNGLLSVVGDPDNPAKLVYRNRSGLPGRGTLFTAAPSSLLPFGLVAKVTASKRTGDKRVLSVRVVPISAAVPEFDFEGSAALKKSPGGVDQVTRAAQAAPPKPCDGPKAFDVGAKLDEFTIRRASATARPAQMSFTMAVRTTERLGPRVAAAGVSCSWDIGALGPWQGFIPTPIPGVIIPVYATIPVKAAASIQGSLSAFKINVASTSILDLDLGQTNRFAFRQEGSNVWVDGVLQLSGTAKVSATLSLELGIGNPKLGDLNVKAGFGPVATWKSGVGCALDIPLGALSVGVKIGKFKKGTPPWSPFSIHVWDGCQDASGQPGGSPGGPTEPSPGLPSPPGGDPTPPQPPPPSPAPTSSELTGRWRQCTGLDFCGEGVSFTDDAPGIVSARETFAQGSIDKCGAPLPPGPYLIWSDLRRDETEQWNGQGPYSQGTYGPCEGVRQELPLIAVRRVAGPRLVVAWAESATGTRPTIAQDGTVTSASAHRTLVLYPVAE